MLVSHIKDNKCSCTLFKSRLKCPAVPEAVWSDAVLNSCYEESKVDLMNLPIFLFGLAGCALLGRSDSKVKSNRKLMSPKCNNTRKHFNDVVVVSSLSVNVFSDLIKLTVVAHALKLLNAKTRLSWTACTRVEELSMQISICCRKWLEQNRKQLGCSFMSNCDWLVFICGSQQQSHGESLVLKFWFYTVNFGHQSLRLFCRCRSYKMIWEDFVINFKFFKYPKLQRARNMTHD